MFCSKKKNIHTARDRQWGRDRYREQVHRTQWESVLSSVNTFTQSYTTHFLSVTGLVLVSGSVNTSLHPDMFSISSANLSFSGVPDTHFDRAHKLQIFHFVIYLSMSVQVCSYVVWRNLLVTYSAFTPAETDTDTETDKWLQYHVAFMSRCSMNTSIQLYTRHVLSVSVSHSVNTPLRYVYTAWYRDRYWGK